MIRDTVEEDNKRKLSKSTVLQIFFSYHLMLNVELDLEVGLKIRYQLQKIGYIQVNIRKKITRLHT